MGRKANTNHKSCFIWNDSTPCIKSPYQISSGGDRGVSLTLCYFVVYFTRRFVLCLILCYFFLVFFSPFNIAITSLGKERANLSAFRTFVWFVLAWFCRFSLPLGVWEGLRVVIVALPGLFSYPFFCRYQERGKGNVAFSGQVQYANAVVRDPGGFKTATVWLWL